MSQRPLGLIANGSKAGAAPLLADLLEAFTSHGLECLLDAESATLLGKKSATTHADMARSCRLLVVLGGDGTLLRVVHDLCDDLPPILGINIGSLGFLTCAGAAAWRQAVEAILHNSFAVSPRTLLLVAVLRGADVVHRGVALNDAVVTRGELSRLIRLNVFVDGNTLSEYNADGLIIATPTGSTAYSLSAGGPVLTPDSGAFVITPICPHVLTMRPVMVSDHSTIEIRPAPGQDDIFMTLDGQDSAQIAVDDRIRITKAAHTLPLAMLPGMSFFEVLRQKLKWSGAAV